MRIELIATNQDIFKVTHAFRELAADVFESFGKSNRNTIIETFHDFGRLESGSAKTGFYSFRNEDFFYWVFIKGRHNLGEQESLEFEFESQVKNAEIPIFQVFAEYLDNGTNVLLNELKPLNNIKLEFSENYTNEVEKIVQHLRGKLF